MSYGIDSPLTNLTAVTIDVAASHCDVSVEQIKEYAREGLVIPMKSENGALYFSDLDYRWITTLKRLLDEAHLSFDGIRQLMLTRCGCWKFRHCEFRDTEHCPMTIDRTQPCWVNRRSWHVLASYPCYSCLVYRTLPFCAGIGAGLHGSASGAAVGGSQH